MNTSKAAILFRRAWNAIRETQPTPPPEVVSMSAGNGQHNDLFVVFVGDMTAYEALIEKTGCLVIAITANVVQVAVPTEWVSFPTRLMLVDSPADALHNALLDAGVSDWLSIRTTNDWVSLEVEFFEHPTAEQIAALKTGYDVLTFDELVYTFVERTSQAAPAVPAPLVDPTKVEAKVRQCWAGGHGGKIASLEAQADPREFIVTTVKPVPLNANLRNHGLALVKQIAPDVTHVRVMDEMWAKLLEAGKPVTAEVDPTSPAFTTGDSGVNVTVTTGDGTQTSETVFADEPEPDVSELDDRDVEIADLKAQVDQLRDIIRALTPVADEWQTLKLNLPKDGKVTAHPEIAAQEALGWQVHTVSYAPNGEDRLFVLMTRKPQTKPAPLYYQAGAGAMVYQPTTIHPISTRFDRMIEEMDAELQPVVQQLRDAFYSVGSVR